MSVGRITEERYGPSLLSELAEMTGGRVFRVSSLGDLPDIDRMEFLYQGK